MTSVSSLALVAVAALCIGYLHVTVHISPISTMVSDYVFTVPGAILLTVGMLALSGSLVLLGVGLTIGGSAGRWAVRLLGTASVGLVLMSLFPADATDVPTTVVGTVHKLSGGLLFGAVPAVGWLLARRFAVLTRWRALVTPLRFLATLGAALFAFFLVTYLPGFGVRLPAGDVLTGIQGLVERCVLLPDVALIVLVAARLARLSRQPEIGVARSPGRRGMAVSEAEAA